MFGDLTIASAPQNDNYGEGGHLGEERGKGNAHLFISAWFSRKSFVSSDAPRSRDGPDRPTKTGSRHRLPASVNENKGISRRTLHRQGCPTYSQMLTRILAPSGVPYIQPIVNSSISRRTLHRQGCPTYSQMLTEPSLPEPCTIRGVPHTAKY
jgi:hypothetical protein